MIITFIIIIIIKEYNSTHHYWDTWCCRELTNMVKFGSEVITAQWRRARKHDLMPNIAENVCSQMYVDPNMESTIFEVPSCFATFLQLRMIAARYGCFLLPEHPSIHLQVSGGANQKLQPSPCFFPIGKVNGPGEQPGEMPNFSFSKSEKWEIQFPCIWVTIFLSVVCPKHPHECNLVVGS